MPNWFGEIVIDGGIAIIMAAGFIIIMRTLVRRRTAALSAEIAERKKVEEALTQEHNRLQTLFEHNGSGHLIVSSTRQILQVNQQLCKMFGYQEEELIGQSAEILHLDRQHYDNWAPLFKEAHNGLTHLNAEYPWRRKDGSIFWCMFTGVKLLLPNDVRSVIWSIIDITERKRMEETLDASNKLLQAVINTAPMRVFWKNTDLLYMGCNNAFANDAGVLGPDNIIGKDDYQLVWKEQAEFCRTDDRSVIESGAQRLFYEEHQTTPDGGNRWLRTSKVPLRNEANEIIGLLGIYEDITEFKRTEEEHASLEKQLLHAQKLESLGVLAGGIAHDFNNILTAIIGNADLALMRLNPESPAVDNLHKIEQSAARAADLAKQMLAYSGKGKFVVESLDLNRLVEEMLHMLEVSISKKAVLRLNKFQNLPAVEVDATQIRQIIMNLVINASEAIGDKSGVIAITTGCMDCDRHYLKDVWLDENLVDGLYVYLEIADSGCGMDRDVLAKIFDPFFTTKFSGRGLGMAAVLGIVRGHKGAIKVYSEPGKGTTFKILLPASDRPAKLFSDISHNDDWKGCGMVLLVDDEETIRGIGVEMLKELGFKIITASDGREALEIFKSNPDIRFVILDLTMPHMDGEQCFRELRLIDPVVKVLISSGYNEQEVSQKFVGKGLAGFVQKPYTLSMLKGAIRGLELS